MDYDIKTQPVPLKKGSVVILPILESETLLPDVAALDADTDKALSKLIKDEHFKGRTGELLYLPHLPGHPGTRILLVGFGTKEKLTAAKFLSSLQPLCEKLRSTQCKQALISFRDLPVQGLTPDALIKAFILSL
jgi:leucyl aminopeptidase